MHRTTRARLEEVNHHLVCVLCGGYFIDATSIIECLHSFCRTCIVTYLETSKYCPICDVQVHKTRPLLNIRADKTLQNLVYKLVPGLFEDEMRRRREFYASRAEGGVEMCLEARGEAVMEKEVVRPDDNISLCLMMSRNGLPPESDDDDNKAADVRYLLCPSAMTVAQLKKFIRIKFSLPDFYKIDMFHTEERLTDTFTLLDIAYLYTWRRRAPLRLFYIVDEKPFKKRKSSAAKTSRDLEVPEEAKKVKIENCTDETSLDKEPVKSQVSVCENSDMFSDISDYEPFPHPDYSQQIQITSEGSDSTITYVDVEESLPKSKGPENESCSEKVCDTPKTKDVNETVTETTKLSNQSRTKEIVQEQLEKIGIEQSKEIEKHVHPVKDQTVKTHAVERHSETNGKSKEACAKQEVVKDIPNDTNSISKNHQEPKEFTKLDVKHETQTKKVETISTKFDQTKLSSKAKCEMFVSTKAQNGISKDKDVSRNSISLTSYIGYSPAKIWQKPNGFNRVRTDNVVNVNGLKPHKTMSKLPKYDDRANNNTIIERPVTNGIDQRLSLEVKSEPLDLSETSRRKTIGPIYISDTDL